MLELFDALSCPVLGVLKKARTCGLDSLDCMEAALIVELATDPLLAQVRQEVRREQGG